MSHHSAAFEQQLTELLDGRLAADEARAVREHLRSCDECLAQYEAMATAVGILRAVPAPAVPADLLESIQQVAAAELSPAPPTIWERWRAPVGALAAAAAILLAVFAPWQWSAREQSSAIRPHPDTSMTATVPDADPAGEAVPATASETSRPDEAMLASADAAAAVGATSGAPAPQAHRAARAARDAAHDAARTAAAAQEPAAQDHPEPALAWAGRPDATSAAASGPMLGEVEEPTMIAMGPRTTIDPKPGLAPVPPSEIELAMATGIVAALVLDQYVAEHMVQSSSTLLSVITDTPSAELGPVLASGDDDIGSFGLCFTDAMRRAFTESENRLP